VQRRWRLRALETVKSAIVVPDKGNADSIGASEVKRLDSHVSEFGFRLSFYADSNSGIDAGERSKLDSSFLTYLRRGCLVHHITLPKN
jgi:hypothetical protein